MIAPTIVCIDDEPSLCRVLRLLLAPTGARIETFTDPDEAIAFVHAHEVALVLCDYRLPATDGLEILARIQRPVPFVIVSGDLDIEGRLRDAPGVRGVLGKPFAAQELLDFVAQQLAASAAER